MDSTSTNPTLMYASVSVSQNNGIVNWASLVPGTAALALESTTQPYVVQWQNKLFTSMVVNTATVGSIGCVYVTAHPILTGVATVNKLVVVDTTY